MVSRKSGFVTDWNNTPFPVAVVVAVKQPSGAIEIITSTMYLADMFEHYLETYDKDLKMYKNKDIEIVNWMVV